MKNVVNCCQVKFKKLKGEEKEPKQREVKEEAPDVGQMGSDYVSTFLQGRWGKSSLQKIFLGSTGGDELGTGCFGGTSHP